MMKILLPLFSLIFCLNFAQAQESFPISPIGIQHAYPGAKITTTLSAVNHDLPSITLTGIDMPDFATFEDHGKGIGTFTFEADSDDVGAYEVQILAISGTDSSRATFQVLVPELPIGNKFFVDPINGNNNNDGSSDNPWKTLAEVFLTGKTITGGDIIYLRTGNHKDPVINKLQSSTTYILAEKGATPMFEKLNFYLAKNWVLSGIKITPEANNTSAKGNYLRVQENCESIVIENCEIYGTSNVMNWPTNQDWYDHAGDGVLIEGKNTLFRNNYIYNVYFGVSVFGTNNIIAHNFLDTYGADGFRGIGNDCKYLYNRIQNALVDDYATGNHDDGFQSWSTNGPVKNVTLKGNQIFSHSDPSLPLKTSVLQALVNFDGFSENWIVEDNLIVTEHPHGLTLLGARNCKISNNTVIQNPLNLFQYGNPPWIRIGPHKDGTRSTGNLNRNNLMAFNYEENDPGTFGPNLIANNEAYFVNYGHWDFHLKPNSAPINSGLKIGGSSLDNSQHLRFDSFPDIGAYEYNSTTYDFEPPSAVSNVQISGLKQNSLTVTWNASTDNFRVKTYHVQTPFGHLITDSLFAELLGLEHSSVFNIDIWAEDLAGNISTKKTTSITLGAPPIDNIKLLIPVAKEDQMILSTDEQRWNGLHLHSVGGLYFFFDASAVLPFKIPTLPEGYEIDQANLIINYNRLVNTPKGSADLYAIASRNSPLVLRNDNWQGAYSMQPSGLALQKEFLNKESELGEVKTNEAVASKLATYLNEAEGQYLFLRINSDQENESNYCFYEFISGNYPNTELRPRLELDLRKVLSNSNITTQNQLKIFPNPVVRGEMIHLSWNSISFSGALQIQITNSLGQLVKIYTAHAGKRKIEIPADIFLNSGTFFISISDAKNYHTTQLVIQDN